MGEKIRTAEPPIQFVGHTESYLNQNNVSNEADLLTQLTEQCQSDLAILHEQAKEELNSPSIVSNASSLVAINNIGDGGA